MNIAAIFCAERFGVYPGGQLGKFDGANDVAIATPHLHTGQLVVAFIDLDHDEGHHTLACMEVWGGNRNVVRTVELPELAAWVYSKPLGAEDGGDVHYLSVCGQAVLSRIVLADVSGHGAQVSVSAQLLHALMREHVNTWDQTQFVRELNRAFRGCVARGKYATAVILGILRGTGETAFTSAGHLPPLW